MDFKKILDDVFEKGSQEYEIVVDCYDLITKTSPVLSSEIKNKMVLLDRARADLSTIYFMLCRNISKKRSLYQQTYDSQYARLVKLGRPSNAAIEAEIRSTCKDYAIISEEIETLEQVKDLISSYMRCIDGSKQTAIELLRDSRRID